MNDEIRNLRSRIEGLERNERQRQEVNSERWDREVSNEIHNQLQNGYLPVYPTQIRANKLWGIQ